MGTPTLGDLLPGVSERVYWQPPFYFLSLSLWGKLFGFDLLSARWFSQIFGAVGLLLLFALMCRWDVPKSIALLCVLWTTLDLPYQYNANLARMDSLNVVFVLTALLTFTVGMEKSKEHWFGLSGLFATMAVLTHWIAFPVTVVLIATLVWQRRWRALVLFSIPLTIGLAGWLVYILQDWSSFIGQMTVQWARKTGRDWSVRLAWLLFLFGVRDFLGNFPSNMPPWSVVAAVSFFAYFRRHLPISGWQWVALMTAYLSAGMGGETYHLG